MRSKKVILLIGFVLAIMIIAAGCSSSQPTEEPATEVPAETELAAEPPTEAPTATQPDEMVEEPEQTEDPEETQDNSSGDAMSSGDASACEECHSDQAMLIDTADPVEEVESENEGAG